MSFGSPGGGPEVDSAAAAVQRAAAATAADAERSGTVIVRITENGQPWAGETVRWNGDDMSLVDDYGPFIRSGGDLRVVNGVLYGPDPEGGWLNLGPPSSIDSDSGTTPTEQLAAIREDVGGETLRRITANMSGLTTRELEDGSTVYSGTVPAGMLATEGGFKEGETIRVLPFGYVAHDEADDPSAPLDVAITVSAGGVILETAVRWGGTDTSWLYTVSYRGLGTTPAPKAPANAQPLRRGEVPAPPRR